MRTQVKFALHLNKAALLCKKILFDNFTMKGRFFNRFFFLQIFLNSPPVVFYTYCVELFVFRVITTRQQFNGQNLVP